MEVGRTNLVEHNIETSEHPPIKQPPRRIPFSLHSKVETFVQEMLSQGVVKESSSPQLFWFQNQTVPPDFAWVTEG